MDISNYIIYLRKSRADSPDMTVEEVLAKHESILQEYALSEFGQALPESQIYREVVSGETISDRPIMKNILRMLESGSVKGVLVVEPQRLSRGDLEDCGKIVNAFRYTNTLVITPPKTYDLSLEYDRKFFEMELMRGNDYLEYIKKVLNRGKIASVKRGEFISSIPPYGYKKVRKGSGKDAYNTLEIVPEEAEAVREIFRYCLEQGCGAAKIARHMDSLGIKPRIKEHWSPSEIREMLSNPVYIGKIRWGYRKNERVLVDGQLVSTNPINRDSNSVILVDGKHEAIIDEFTFNAIKDKYSTIVPCKKGNSIRNPFAGLIRCQCGKSMNYKTHKNSSGSFSNNLYCNDQYHCRTRSVKYEDFEQRVCEYLENTIEDFKVKLKNNDDTAEKIRRKSLARLKDQLEKLKEKDSRQKDAFEDGIYTKEEYLQRNTKLQEEIQKVSAELEAIEEQVPKIIDYNMRIVKLQQCLDMLRDETASAENKNRMLRSCLSGITYSTRTPYGKGTTHIKNDFSLQIFLNF